MSLDDEQGLARRRSTAGEWTEAPEPITLIAMSTGVQSSVTSVPFVSALARYVEALAVPSLEPHRGPTSMSTP